MDLLFPGRRILTISGVIGTANIHEHAVYPSINRRTTLGMITLVLGSDALYRTRGLELTEKGRYIARRLNEIKIALASK